MTTYDWPTDRACRPQAETWQLRTNTIANVSPLNGAMQAVTLPGSRWVVTLDFPAQSWDERRRLEAFLHQLNGMEHRVRYGDSTRAQVPWLGDRGGAPLMAGAVAQFASAIAIDGTLRTRANHISWPEDMRNSAEAGAARPWTQFDDTGDAVAVVMTAGVNPLGATQSLSKITAGSVGAVTRQITQPLSTPSDDSYVTTSVYLKAGECTAARIYVGTRAGLFPYLAINLLTGATTASNGGGPSVSGGAVDAGGGWWRAWFRSPIQSGGTAASVTIGLRSAGDGGNFSSTTIGDGLYAWGAQVEYFFPATPYEGIARLTAGDLIELPLSGGGSQLVEVVNDPAPSSSAISGIQVRPMLRAAVADNAAVNVSNPRATFALANADQLASARRPGGVCGPISVELVEAF